MNENKKTNMITVVVTFLLLGLGVILLSDLIVAEPKNVGGYEKYSDIDMEPLECFSEEYTEGGVIPPLSFVNVKYGESNGKNILLYTDKGTIKVFCKKQIEMNSVFPKKGNRLVIMDGKWYIPNNLKKHLNKKDVVDFISSCFIYIEKLNSEEKDQNNSFLKSWLLKNEQKK